MLVYTSEDNNRNMNPTIPSHIRAHNALVENDNDEIFALVNNGLLDINNGSYIRTAIISGNLDMVVFLHEQGFVYTQSVFMLAEVMGYPYIAEYVNQNFT